MVAWLLLAPAASAASLTGIWVGRITVREGLEQDIAFQFQQRGEKLTGKLYGDSGSTRIAKGRVTGDTLWFVVITSEQAGNQLNTTRLRFEGKLLGETLELTRQRESSTNAGNAGGVQTRSDARQPITLKRLW